MTIAYATRLLTYDLWANQRILLALDAWPDLLPDSEPARLFSHLLRAQQIWHERVQNTTRSYQELWPVLDPASWRSLLQANHDAWLDVLPGDDAGLDMMIRYRNSKGTSFATSLRDIVQHVMIHGQHHRAQIAVHLRRKGCTPPRTDYIYFTRDASATSEQA